jgi:hypothetical protein
MGENRIKFAAREIEAGGTCMLATDSPKRVFPGLAAFHERIAPFGYPLMRIAAGAIIMPHAFPKLFGSFAPVLAKNVLAPLGFLDFPDPLFWVGHRDSVARSRFRRARNHPGAAPSCRR